MSDLEKKEVVSQSESSADSNKSQEDIEIILTEKQKSKF